MSELNLSTHEEFIALYAKKQKHIWGLCPRCGLDRMNKDIMKNALSRRANIMVCSICGNIEAIEDIPGHDKLPLNMWELSEHPERYFLRGKDFHNFYFTFGSWEGFPFQNAYIVVEGFDRNDARARFRRMFPDKIPGVACYAFDYSEESFRETDMARKTPCSGVLRLNGEFAPAE